MIFSSWFILFSGDVSMTLSPYSGGGISERNASWLDSHSVWVTYLAIVALVHFVILSIPVLSLANAWTLTNITHNVVSITPNLTLASSRLF